MITIAIYAGPRRYVTLPGTSGGTSGASATGADPLAPTSNVRRSTTLNQPLHRATSTAMAQNMVSSVSLPTLPSSTSTRGPIGPQAPVVSTMTSIPPAPANAYGPAVPTVGPTPISSSTTTTSPTAASSTTSGSRSSVTLTSAPIAYASSGTGGVSSTAQQIRALQAKSLPEVRQIAHSVGLDERGCKTKDDLINKIVQRIMM
jgi:hypothetical protein